MSSGAKVGVVIAVVVGLGILVVGGLMVAGVGWFWMRASTGEQARLEATLQQEAAVADEHAAAAVTTQAETVAPAAAPDAPADTRPLAERRTEAIARGVAYLLAEQAPDGSWGKGNVGITGLCADALLECGKTLGDAPVKRAIDFLLKAQKEDGGIYDDVGLKTYTTSIGLMVLVKADPKAYADPAEKAKAYLIKHQWDEQESIDTKNPWYGGHGYGQHERPDLSNTQYFVQAMHEAGVPKDHPLWKKVVVFVSRSQDRSESNDGMVVGTDSGGMVYTPAGGGESKADYITLPDGRKGLKAYGSMTYAGFKSFMYANLKKDDPRVQAAMGWIRKHWTFEENPELGEQGLYYYYETAAKALKAWGEDRILDARRRPHDWKAELTEAILRRQQAAGFWTNEADRWFEGFPPVPTSYCLIALAHCR
ncbi:MAG TPA: prenyltransferase/squalene oxidase repeat-containing protein [Phycisphaerae bacterium]|nr:prenyltransferase/squalene oxidase repeat-containing protein [Phycisphaerae bacterium]